MSEFDRARERKERLLVKQAVKLGENLPRPILTLPSKQKGRSNEIEVTIWVNGEAFDFHFDARITGNIMASQISEKSLRQIVASALSTKFVGIK